MDCYGNKIVRVFFVFRKGSGKVIIYLGKRERWRRNK